MPDLPPVFSGPRNNSQARKREQAKARNQNRALATGHRRWRRIREIHLQREPLCRYHLQQGETKAATDVDHIDGNAYNNHPDNLQSLCKACHARKTVSEMTRDAEGRWG